MEYNFKIFKTFYLQIRVANVLGVVGTDVSIDQIKKLVPPYKVNLNNKSQL